MCTVGHKHSLNVLPVLLSTHSQFALNVYMYNKKESFLLESFSLNQKKIHNEKGNNSSQIGGLIYTTVK